jgi:hypothetical protein
MVSLLEKKVFIIMESKGQLGPKETAFCVVEFVWDVGTTSRVGPPSCPSYLDTRVITVSPSSYR